MSEVIEAQNAGATVKRLKCANDASLKAHHRALLADIRRSRRGPDWRPAPPDTGIVPGGIRDRALKAFTSVREAA